MMPGKGRPTQTETNYVGHWKMPWTGADKPRHPSDS